MHLPRLWNSLVSTSEQHLYKKGEKKGIKICNVAVLMKKLVGFLAGFLALGEWQPYCKALEIYLRQIATHSILSKNKAVEIFLTSSEVSWRKHALPCVLNPLFLWSAPVKRTLYYKREQGYTIFFTSDADNKRLNFHCHCFRGETEEIHVTYLGRWHLWKAEGFYLNETSAEHSP